MEATEDITDKVKRGTSGAIVYIYADGEAYEVEFFDDNDNTLDVLTVFDYQLT